MSVFRLKVFAALGGFLFLLLSSTEILGYVCSSLRTCNGGPTCTISSTRAYCSKEASDSPICNCPDTTQYIHCLEGAYSFSNCCPYNNLYIDNMGSGYCTRSIDATYPNGGTCECCTQINCDCTPKCPTGSYFTNTGAYCYAGKSSCSESNECSECTDYGAACYYPETNTSFVQSNGSTAGPTSITMTVDGTAYTLSTDPNNPTVIKLPQCSSPTVQLSVPAFTAPTTSRGANYYFQADNYGVDGQWQGWVSCAGTAGEDFCTGMPNSNRTQTLVPYSLTINQVFKEGAEGKISAQYATTNKCDDNFKYSVARVGYYIVETVKPTVNPTSVNITVDGKTYSLSSSASTPTTIKLPSLGSSDVQVSVPTFTASTSSTGANYYFKTDNYGLNGEWTGGTACQGIAGEDFCLGPNANNTQTFDPYTKTVAQVLKEGAKGKITVQYAATNKCTTSWEYSSAFTGYYLVNKKPVPNTNIFPDIATDITPKGCASLTYTGLDINNPLHVVINATDADGNGDIQASTIWFTKDDTIPTTGTITGTYSGSSNQDLGIMIKKNGTTWSNPYIYVTNTSPFTFAIITNGYVTVNGSNIARIYDVSVIQDSTDVTFDYKIEFLQSAQNLSGMYNVYGGALDSFMINGNSLDQSYFTSLTDWGIDLVNPVANDITQEIYDATRTNITWSVSDTISGIDRTVINAYRTGGLVTDNVTLYLPTAYTTSKGIVTSQSLPPASDIGKYAGTNAWVFTTSTGEKDRLSIGNNESGSIAIYATTYDKACNTASTNEELDLNPWFATRGGNVYSQGNISTDAKDVSSVTSLDNVFSSKAGMTKEKLDLGTELLSTGDLNISNLIHSTAGAIRALITYDMNNSKNYWFGALSSEFEKYKLNSTAFVPTTTSVSADCMGTGSCYYISLSAEADINIPSGYICDRPTLIISNRDIYLEPNVTNGAGLSGCIFLAKNNIYIDDASYLSATQIKYDYLEGFFIADNQIVFPLVDPARTRRDGVEIFGGLVAFGSNISDNSKAISINRNLRLYNQTNPTLVVTYDNRYSNISKIFFGQQASIYKQELGFKSY